MHVARLVSNPPTSSSTPRRVSAAWIGHGEAARRSSSTLSAVSYSGGINGSLVRSVAPSVELLQLQAEVNRICTTYLEPAAAPNTAVGQWTPHVTLARRVDASQLSRALTIRNPTRDIRGSVVGLRRWDGNKRVEHVIH